MSFKMSDGIYMTQFDHQQVLFEPLKLVVINLRSTFGDSSQFKFNVWILAKPRNLDSKGSSIKKLKKIILEILTNFHDRFWVWKFSHRCCPQSLACPGDLGNGEHGHHVVRMIRHLLSTKLTTSWLTQSHSWEIYFLNFFPTLQYVHVNRYSWKIVVHMFSEVTKNL